MTGAPIFETLGCRLNAYESEAMRGQAEAAGLNDLVVINTCAVTAEAVRTAKQKIRRAARENPGKKIVVTGCAAQIDPRDFADMAEVDHVLGNHEKLTPESWRNLANGQANDKVQVRDIMAQTTTNAPLIDGLGTRARAYVQVQNGCDHRCTFCIIPYGRGNSRSVPADVVVEQIKRLVARGYNEVVLTGVDMTSWGADLAATPRLGDLVTRILKLVPDLARLRISSIDSIEADPALIEAICHHPRLMPHLHLSLQAGDNMILKRMKRRHMREDAIEFCQMLRAARPEMVFGADIIAGFPTETEAMFENSLALVADCGLTWLHVFPYSIRQGTPAARMPQVARDVIKSRAARLRALGDGQVATYLAAQVGRVQNVLMEAPRKGRNEGFAPVVFERDQPVGQIVRAKISGHDGAVLLGRP
ncbi:MAG: tRNA (N(6)-L-threonylcarbamoyladenosine(37)-C(2))-methylthiotransferase MtaB [Alphaproteobacteria bacterium]|nr:tRNA (N(6)-L-threonylcarbamoyladenosine(37)-C(2))-methylthiotransferase MtaB [Alphaproteobacteria bacterium]